MEVNTSFSLMQAECSMNLDVTLLKVLLGENASKEGTHELPLKVHVNGGRIRIRIDDEGTIFRLLNAAFGWTEDYWDRMLDGDVTSDQASKFRKFCQRVYFQFEESWKAERFHKLMQRLREISGGGRIRIRIDDEGTIFRLLNAAFGWTGDYWDRMLDGDVTSDQASTFRKSCQSVYFQFEESWKAERFHKLMQRLREISGGDAPPVVRRHK